MLNKNKSHFNNWILKAFFVLIVSVLMIPEKVEATHFRYGNISWTHVSGRTITFHVTQGWRRSFYGAPNVGNVVNTSVLEFGNGATANINLTVTSVNLVEDWFFGEADITYTYPAGLANYTAFFFNCCRISSLQQGNNDQNFRVQTTVNFTGNKSPVSSMPPIQNVQINTNPATFILAASDPDGNTLAYRLSTQAEMGGAPLTNPVGLSIDPVTGLVSWNTIGKVLGGLYMVQFTVEDGQGGSTVVDMILRIVAQSNPPYFDYAVTPPNGTIYEIQPGVMLCFNVKAQDNDLGDVVTLSAVGLPPGVVLVPLLPANGNPVQTNFCWTPTMAQLGSRVVNFTAQDVNGASVNSSVTIIVSLDPIFDVPPTPPAASSVCIEPGQLYTANIQAHAPDTNVTVQITGASVPAGSSFAPALPSPAGNTTATTISWTPTVAQWGSNILTYTATDNLLNSTNHSYEVVVNTPPAFTSVQNTVVICAGTPFSYVVTSNDPDVPYGDSVSIFALSLPSWLTLTPNGPGSVIISGTPGPGDVGNVNVHIELEDLYHHHCMSHVHQDFGIFVVTSIDDNNVCTVDGCDPVNGPTYTQIDTDDGIACTIDGCDSVSGPYHTPVPPVAGPIFGPAVHCDATTVGVGTFYIDPIPGVTYDWDVPLGMTIVSGLGTNSIYVSWIAPSGKGINGPLCVTVSNDCGTDESCVNIDINTVKPVQTSSVSGPTKICPGDIVTYSVAPITRANGYDWILPTGMIIIGGAGTNVITVAVDALFTGGTLNVAAMNACGTGPYRSRVLTQNIPSTPSAIGGNAAGVCGMTLVYTVPLIANATSYDWSVPVTAILNSGQGSNSISVSFPSNFTGGSITVRGLNGCGYGPVRTLAIVGAPGLPGVITGPVSVCAGSTRHYSIATVPNTTTYTWTAPGPILGQGTKDIDVIFGPVPTGGLVVSVKASNTCGSSAARSISGIVIVYCPKISDETAAAISVYPNPAQNEINISFNVANNQHYELQLMDALGRVVYTESNSATEGENNIRIDIAKFDAGVYTLSLQTENGSENKKLIIE